MNHWSKYVVWGIWVAGGRHITTLSNGRSFPEVLQAIQEYLDQIGVIGGAPQPFILVNHYYLNPEDRNALEELPEGSITLTIE
jgi:uncharacterized protein YlzI (FlbEa/FlbD family)